MRLHHRYWPIAVGEHTHDTRGAARRRLPWAAARPGTPVARAGRDRGVVGVPRRRRRKRQRDGASSEPGRRRPRCCAAPAPGPSPPAATRGRRQGRPTLSERVRSRRRSPCPIPGRPGPGPRAARRREQEADWSAEPTTPPSRNSRTGAFPPRPTCVGADRVTVVAGASRGGVGLHSRSPTRTVTIMGPSAAVQERPRRRSTTPCRQLRTVW